MIKFSVFHIGIIVALTGLLAHLFVVSQEMPNQWLFFGIFICPVLLVCVLTPIQREPRIFFGFCFTLTAFLTIGFEKYLGSFLKKTGNKTGESVAGGLGLLTFVFLVGLTIFFGIFLSHHFAQMRGTPGTK